MKISKNLTSGCFCQMIGGKVCRINKNKDSTKILGVFHPMPTIISAKTKLFDGKLRSVSMDVPAGIRIGGFNQIEIYKENKQNEDNRAIRKEAKR